MSSELDELRTTRLSAYLAHGLLENDFDPGEIGIGGTPWAARKALNKVGQRFGVELITWSVAMSSGAERSRRKRAD
jgi:hypothetical protein